MCYAKNSADNKRRNHFVGLSSAVGLIGFFYTFIVFQLQSEAVGKKNQFTLKRIREQIKFHVDGFFQCKLEKLVFCAATFWRNVGSVLFCGVFAADFAATKELAINASQT